MYIRELHIDGLKLLRNFDLSFTRDGEPRMWTVLVGRNGLCKTSILRAIALAAAGRDLANQLAVAQIQSLPDLRSPGPTTIRADFELARVPYRRPRQRPVEQSRTIVSQLELPLRHRVLTGTSHHANPTVLGTSDPLAEARAEARSNWFVAGYGVERNLPATQDHTDDRILTRMQSLFDAGHLVATDFGEYFKRQGRDDMAEIYSEAVEHALFNHEQLLPQLRGIESNPASRASFTLLRDATFKTNVDGLHVSASWLSGGYRTTIAWIADLVGHLVWDWDFDWLGSRGSPQRAAEDTSGINHSSMEGLVLIDELDLHLHPSWQVGLIPALKQTFPRLQFVVTTHSPMLLAGLEGDEIVMLDQDPETGDITQHSDPRPAKLMTGTEMLGRYFGIDQLYPVNLSAEAHRYGYLAGDPHRTDAEQAELDELRRRLEAAGVAPDWDPVPRKAS